MVKILQKNIISINNPQIVKFILGPTEIAAKALPGQFVMLVPQENGERIPLTIVDTDKNKKTITIILQEAGFTTKLLGGAKDGDTVYGVVGPLGNPTDVKKYGSVLIIGGGIGVAEILPVARALKNLGNRVIAIIGAKTHAAIILEDEMQKASDALLVATDDGSYGQKGFVTDILTEVMNRENIDLVYAVGPIPMMKAVSEITKEAGIKTIVSLNAIMVDGTGMCGCCRVRVSAEIKFSCVDGPEFDAHAVDWDELANRNKAYISKEKHVCKING